jgi:competence protein ComEA
MATLDRDQMRQPHRASREASQFPPRRSSLASPLLRIGLSSLAILATIAVLPSCSPPPENKAQNTPTISFPIDLNSAPPEQLAQIPGVGPVLAMRIVAARPFSEISDLIHVQGIGEQTLFKIAPYLSLSPPPEPAPISTPEFPDITIPSP